MLQPPQHGTTDWVASDTEALCLSPGDRRLTSRGRRATHLQQAQGAGVLRGLPASLGVPRPAGTSLIPAPAATWTFPRASTCPYFLSLRGHLRFRTRLLQRDLIVTIYVSDNPISEQGRIVWCRVRAPHSFVKDAVRSLATVDGDSSSLGQGP